MKPFYYYLIALAFFCANSVYFSSAQENKSFDFVEGSFREVDEKTIRISQNFIDEWPADVNGNDNVALIQVKLEHIPQQDIPNINFSNAGPNARICHEKDMAFISEGFLNIFVPAIQGLELVAKLGDRTTNRYRIERTLRHKACYTIVLDNNQTTTIHIVSIPENAQVYLDNELKGTTPLDIPNTPMGKHQIRLTLDNGRQIQEKDIEVSQNKVLFDDFDLREKKKIRFTSNPSGAEVFVDDEKVSRGTTPCTLDLTYESHIIRMQADNNRKEVFDITIDQYTPMIHPEVELLPKKEISIEAYVNGNSVEADLDIDGDNVGRNAKLYNTALTYGQHSLHMSYKGYSTDEKIKVSDNSKSHYRLNIPIKKSFTWFWRKEYDTDPFGISVSYVQKWWNVKHSDKETKINPVWNVESDVLDGIQAGVFYEPAWWFGLGIYTGVFYEYYYSKASKDDIFTKTFETEEFGVVKNEYDFFSEHSIYIPLHLYYRIPFSKKWALKLHGGLGMDYGVYTSFTSRDNEHAQPLEDYYEEDSYSAENTQYPKRINFSIEGAVSLRMGNIMLNFQYSQGITDHELYNNPDISWVKMNKKTFGLSYVFGND